MEPQTARPFNDQFAEYLSQPAWRWSWFVTQTFDDLKQKPYPAMVKHSWRFMMYEIARSAGCTYSWVFAEIGRFGRIHWHALVHVTPNLRNEPNIDEVWNYMYKRYGRCHLDPINGPDKGQYPHPCIEKAQGVTAYLTKYVAKDQFQGSTYWDFMGFLGGSLADSRRIQSAIGLPKAGP